MLNEIKKVTTFINEVQIVSQNRRISIVRPMNDDHTSFIENQNLICIKSLTANTGTNPGTENLLLCNDKIKLTNIGLSDISLRELFCALSVHFDTLDERDQLLREHLDQQND